MSVVKCQYCQVRIPPRQLPLHLKSCINYRRMLKAGKIDKEIIEANKTIAGSIDSYNAPVKDAKKINDKTSTKANKDQSGKKAQR